jgi:SAM-dependent methyltransferase
LEHEFSAINLSKANFDEIYTAGDPRSYFSVLGSLDYMIPDVAEPVVRQILAAKTHTYGRQPLVLDVGCSYGINAAVHRFPLGFNTLRARYARREMMALGSEEVARLDRNFYAGWPDVGLARFIGLDVSAPAIRYATHARLIDHGIIADLESNPLAPEDARIVRPADVLLSTGAVGYVTDRTYRKLLSAVEHPLWVVSFVLRMFPYDPLEEALSEHGLVTERLASATFVQRRFRDVEEFEKTLAALAERGIDTNGFGSEGLFHAELFVSRPAADVRAAPLDELVTVTSGRNRPIGARYVQFEGEEGPQISLEP